MHEGRALTLICCRWICEQQSRRGDYASTEMRIGQLPAGHLGGSTLGVCGRQTCPV